MISNAKTELLSQMLDVVIESVHRYRTDFTKYDIPSIIDDMDDDNLSGYWFVRETGTHLLWDNCREINSEIYFENLRNYAKFNERAFRIYKEGILIEIDIDILRRI